jgi:hypothetical protein
LLRPWLPRINEAARDPAEPNDQRESEEERISIHDDSNVWRAIPRETARSIAHVSRLVDKKNEKWRTRAMYLQTSCSAAGVRFCRNLSVILVITV